MWPSQKLRPAVGGLQNNGLKRKKSREHIEGGHGH